MASLVDVVLSYFIYYLPSILLTSSAFLIGILTYFIGKKKNLQLLEKYSILFKNATGNRISKLELVEANTIGRTFIGETSKVLSVKNFRLHFTMVKRHLILSKIGSILRKTRDYILLEADPTDSVVKRYQLEILQKSDEGRIKALVDMLHDLDNVNLGEKIDYHFAIKSNDNEFFLASFKDDPSVIKKIYSQKDQIIRISYYPLETPSIRIVAEMKEGLNPKFLIDILFDLTASITKLGRTGYYSKQREGPTRIVRDKTIEKDKKEFR